ncbi:MAG: hypothetical protein K8R69_09715 [Deltaproteobacteria bacterium]|nr:hypothetical protein [Deltaproteobacteria bacterium]
MITLDQILRLFDAPLPPEESHPPLPPEEKKRATPTETLPENCHKIGDLTSGKSLWECEEKIPTPLTDSILDLAENIGGFFSKGFDYYKNKVLGGRYGSPFASPPVTPQKRL